MRIRSIVVWVMAAGLVSAPAALGAGGPAPTAVNNAQVTVTVRTRQPGVQPVVSPDDVMVYENNQSRPVVSWVAAKEQSGPLDLTILMDGSVAANVSLQFRDLADFFQTLPAETQVRVAYASYGRDQVAQDFTSDYRLAANALRIPVGATMAGASIYQSVYELLKNWPRDGNRCAVLVISDGIDINQGFEESEPTQNTELQLAINLAQKDNVPIYTIFARGARSLERNWFLLDNGQGCLLRLSSETGGQSYFQGTYTPIDFAPYLKQFANDLHHQYVLTFQPLLTAHAGYQRLRITTPIPGIELSAPSRIFIPNAG